jgi:hypothetical protein
LASERIIASCDTGADFSVFLKAIPAEVEGASLTSVKRHSIGAYVGLSVESLSTAITNRIDR